MKQKDKANILSGLKVYSLAFAVMMVQDEISVDEFRLIDKYMDLLVDAINSIGGEKC